MTAKMFPKTFERKLEESHNYAFSQRQRANWSRLVPEIAFVRLKCNAIRERAIINEIAGEAFATYSHDFFTSYRDTKLPDYALVLLTLNETKRKEWGYVAADWFRGGRLTKKGLLFARDIERRKKEIGRKAG